jgi:hypothetical protein
MRTADVTEKGSEKNPGLADDVLDRFMAGGAANEIAQAGAFVIRGRPIGIGVEAETIASKNMRHKHFRAEARAVEAGGTEVVADPCEQRAGGPGVGLGRR